MQPNVTTISQAAEEKDCGRNAIYRAIDRGDIDTAEVGSQRMVLRNEKFERFAPKNVGFRRQKEGAGE